MSDNRILQLLRTKEISNSKIDAINYIKSLPINKDKMSDGTPFLCRYKNDNNEVKALLGILLLNENGETAISLINDDVFNADDIDMDGYILPEEISNIVNTDTVAEAIGKLEKKTIIINDNIDAISNKIEPLTVQFIKRNFYAEINKSTNITLEWKITKGNESIIPTEIKINDDIVDNNLTNITYSDISNDIIYKIQVKYNNEIANDNASITFVPLSYFGKVSADFIPNDTNIKSNLKKIVSEKTNKYETTVNLTNEKICYAFPKDFFYLKSIKDGNNLEYINSYKRNEIWIDNILYYVYVLKTPITITNFIQTYL